MSNCEHRDFIVKGYYGNDGQCLKCGQGFVTIIGELGAELDLCRVYNDSLGKKIEKLEAALRESSSE